MMGNTTIWGSILGVPYVRKPPGLNSSIWMMPATEVSESQDSSSFQVTFYPVPDRPDTRETSIACRNDSHHVRY